MLKNLFFKTAAMRVGGPLSFRYTQAALFNNSMMMNAYQQRFFASKTAEQPEIIINADEKVIKQPKKAAKNDKKQQTDRYSKEQKMHLNTPTDVKIVHQFKPKRNPFLKLGFNENHIPHQGNYEKVKKQKLEAWENPTYSWPPFLPRPTMHNGKTLISELEKEYMDKIKITRPFKVPTYRSGDVVDVTMFRSLSEGKFNKYRGVIYSLKNPNSLDKTFKMHFNAAEQNMSMQVKEFSPMVAKIDIHRYGSNQLRKKMNHIHHLDLSKTRVEEPIIKGRDYKAREKKFEAAKEANPEREKGKARRESSKLESSYDD